MSSHKERRHRISDFTRQYCFFIQNNRSGKSLRFWLLIKPRVSSRVVSPPEGDACPVTQRNNLQPVAQGPSSPRRGTAQTQTEHKAVWEACMDAAHSGMYASTPGCFNMHALCSVRSDRRGHWTLCHDDATFTTDHLLNRFSS